MRIYACALLFSLALTIVLGFIVVPLLYKLKAGQSILGYVKEHSSKSGTATMGGLFFIPVACAAYFICARGFNRAAAMSAAIGLAYMAVGFLDDFIKVRLHRNEGLKPYQKILFQLAIAVMGGFFALYSGLTSIYLPYTDRYVDLGAWIVPCAALVFIAAVNSVNLTDGLDGLAGGVCWVYFAFLGAITLMQYKNLGVNAENAPPLALMCFCLTGALLGFLVFNTYKARVFMGDTGSLALGGFVASLSVFGGNTLIIAALGIMFVLSSVSDIIQVLHFKRTGRRVFLMAPLHHHFQHLGYSESKIGFVYKLITAAVGLSLTAALM